jgi:hypothetical protein
MGIWRYMCPFFIIFLGTCRVESIYKDCFRRVHCSHRSHQNSTETSWALFNTSGYMSCCLIFFCIPTIFWLRSFNIHSCSSRFLFQDPLLLIDTWCCTLRRTHQEGTRTTDLVRTRPANTMEPEKARKDTRDHGWSLKTWLSTAYIWANEHISLTWIKAIWGWFPLLTMIPVRSHWGRYNLPTHIYIFWYIYIIYISTSLILIVCCWMSFFRLMAKNKVLNREGQKELSQKHNGFTHPLIDN